MLENVTQIRNGIKINITVGANIQEKMCTKKVIFGILLNVLVKIFDMQETLLTILWLCVMKLKKQQKVFQQILTKQKWSVK